MEDENNFKNDHLLNSEESDQEETSLVVSNINSEVFSSPELKEEIENLFREFSEEITFQYFKSFHRLRVNFANSEPAAEACAKIHLREFHNSVLKCHFIRPIILNKKSNKSLELPKPTKQFLISPPSSPPLGWEQIEESEPIFNHELVAALSNLTSGGEIHEIHAASENQPAIYVHTAIDQRQRPKLEFVQTRCPERKSNNL
ncbi:hypothetical protein PVAND_013451 [Polypedilum vanderplanki]|uniref:Calcipressin-like protein n=1 Tax=Polypedilum vanderplanki TaxID=319348 RepID=A0A9J6CQP9_POLVA|nr:hypothetical protein PVAND_013451 [Polypedilum vanderplanki]